MKDLSSGDTVTVQRGKQYVLKRGKCICALHICHPKNKKKKKKKRIRIKNFRIMFSDGRKEDVYFDKITSRIQKLCYGLNAEYIDPVSVLRNAFFGSGFPPPPPVGKNLRAN